MYVSSFLSISPCFVTSFEQVFCTVTSCFRVFLIYLINHLLRNRNGFLKKKKKDVCFIVSFRFTLFRNKHISNFLVSFILFQRFSTISYSFHLLRNRNGFIKKPMYVSLFHSLSACFVTSFEQVFWSVTSCFRVFLIYLNRFICYETEMGLSKKQMYVSLFHSVSLCFVTSVFQIFCSVSSCIRIFPIYFNRFICYETEKGL